MFATNILQSSDHSQSSEKKFISFKLGLKDIALLPLECIAELCQVSIGDILPVPEIPNGVLGIYNWREEILWLLDINALTGFPAITQQELLLTMMAMVVQVEGKFLGLLVPQVNDIEVLDVQDMKIPDHQLFKDELMPFLQGYFITKDNEILRVLNPEAISQVSLWSQK
ncbi:MAG TPA: chemotaxis protein CheW [Oculatellaceae cyanobacterium]|jgi:positive phototaxis protein PixI